ncbi:dolichyl monophosphate biosynthetic process [Tritrichomonas musculus]|uniref:Dolichyl monophosphate biosynthetic process n=1 Tax=Tritrichomonas musculus TaxID=1915356 RepID=A0ABR2KE86_9EUKA
MSFLTQEDIQGFAYSFLLLGSILIIARLLTHVDGISPEAVRKFIHISISNWWFILSNYFSGLWQSLTGPILFIIVNSLATFLDWARFFGMNDRTRNYGLIHFPLSLAILIILQHFNIITEYMTGIAVLIMGYGDGLAALLGKKFGVSKIHPLVGKKTYVGSFTMLITSIFIMVFFSELYQLGWATSFSGISIILITAIVATLLEVLTPFGLDNLSVPIGTALSLKLLIPLDNVD